MKIDLLITGANVVTLDDERPRSGAIAIHRGRVLTCDEREIEALRPAVTVNAAGATVVPGFGDAHNHMAWYGLSLDEIDLIGVTDMERLYALVAERAKQLPPEQMVIGSGYDDNVLGGHPDRDRLDEAAGGRPVWLKHRSGHMCTVNGTMLERLAVDEVIEGGLVVRKGGRPTGLLEEQAQNLVVSLVTPYPLDTITDALARASTVYAGQGLTHVTECGIGAGWLGKSPLELAAYQRCLQQGRLAVRAQVMPCVSALHSVHGHEEDGIDFGLDLGMRTGFGDEHLRLGAMKIWTDGSMLGRTAAMQDPYECRCGSDGVAGSGYLQDDPERMRTQIVAAHAAGWDVAAHAIGDAAIEFALDAFAAAQQACPRPDARHRIEHAGVVSDAAIIRFQRLGVTPVPQMRFLYDLGDSMVTAVGQQRSHLLYRHASFLAAGVRVPGSSDRPVADGRPLAGIATMQDRLSSSGALIGADERVEAMTALRAYTTDAAWMARDEHRRGRLSPGMLADLVLLDTDITAAPPENVADAVVLATLLGGHATHDSGLDLPTPPAPLSGDAR
ncbi:amidohydrolase [Gephyromycinifex aptenodytis]|uniref:amidohydrolase n=1 Tax=Gephyromycinifex aptenodytis TaxID=2716227 RepID=UPI001445AE53|nr:amidohydrolase [Gephyromycinifex aptenodytis]